MGASDLDDPVPALGLVGQPRVHQAQRWNQLVVNPARGGDVHRGRETVVRRLALVDMVVGVNRLLAAALAGQHFIGAAGDHLIGVHVRLSARAGLPDHQRKLAIEIPAGYFGGRLLDHFGELGVEPSNSRIHPCRRLLHEAQSMDDLHGHLLARPEREVTDRPLGLGAPISIGGHLDGAEAVRFAACVVGHGLPRESSSPRKQGSTFSCWARLKEGGPRIKSGVTT